jgi:hypothetical protein
MLARAVNDEQLSNRILKACRRAATKIATTQIATTEVCER